MHKNNLKWIIDITAKPKTIKILGENICGFELGKIFLYLTPRAQTIKKKKNGVGGRNNRNKLE